LSPYVDVLGVLDELRSSCTILAWYKRNESRSSERSLQRAERDAREAPPLLSNVKVNLVRACVAHTSITDAYRQSM
jgi:hypothetical protein